MSDKPDRDWKLKLRYGKLATPYRHFTLLADGLIRESNENNGCPAGPAFMAMKAWASSADEAVEMIGFIGPELGFAVTGRIQVYDTDPAQPPRDEPFGYDINFTPYAEGASD
jgi:hypothetical protein